MQLTADVLKAKRAKYYQDNKELIKARIKASREKHGRKYNPVVERKQKLKSIYKIDWNIYLEMYNKQKGLCAICLKFLSIEGHKTTKPYVDHCHNSNKVRGLLCHNCNLGLGNFKDNSSYLQQAINYLNAA